MSFFDIKPNRRGLLKVLSIAFIIPLIMNICIFLLGIHKSTTVSIHGRLSLLPPSWVIGSIWIFLIMGIGYTYWLCICRRSNYSKGVVLLFLICVLYPIYTAGFAFYQSALLGNLLTISLAAFIAGGLYRSVPIGTWILLILVIWVCFATFAVFN